MSPRLLLITGADGFIGSHLVEQAVLAGDRVRALCHYNSRGSLGWLEDLAPEIVSQVEVELGDIRDAGLVSKIATDVDVVMHLAAQISIPYSYQAPETFLDTNVKGTLNVLEAARRGLCGRVIHTSTSEVYGTPEVVPICESHPLQGQSPYSASKIAADKFCEAYAASYEVPVQILRPFNTYGPRQSARAVLPTILSQLLAGKTTIQLGSLHPRRDLTFVTDTARAYLAAAAKPLRPGQVIHLGTGVSVSVGELFETSCRALGVQAEVEIDSSRIRPAASEVQELLSDPSFAAGELGWTAQIGLEEGLRLTAEWIRKHPEEFDVERYAI